MNFEKGSHFGLQMKEEGFDEGGASRTVSHGEVQNGRVWQKTWTSAGVKKSRFQGLDQLG